MRPVQPSTDDRTGSSRWNVKTYPKPKPETSCGKAQRRKLHIAYLPGDRKVKPCIMGS